METPKQIIFATEKSWIEQGARDQFETVSRLRGVVRSVAYPDLHPGRGIPVGVAIASQGLIYPHLIGNDIGCGMGLFKTGIAIKDFKPDRLWRKLDAIESLHHRGDSRDELGSIGGGNHFAEFTSAGDEELYLLVHSGSRGLGESIYDKSIRTYAAQNGLEPQSEGFEWYIEAHDEALDWARENRLAIAQNCLLVMGCAPRAVAAIDCVHNAIEHYSLDRQSLYVHRKGAAKADNGPVVIPGSRGSHSYVVQALSPSFDSLYSLAHGAGRKWARAFARDKMSGPGQREAMKKSNLGSWVYCRDKTLLAEEAPEAYKNIDRVIADLERFGLARVEKKLKPLFTIKF